jgi:hypothetical protein
MTMRRYRTEEVAGSSPASSSDVSAANGGLRERRDRRDIRPVLLTFYATLSRG